MDRALRIGGKGKGGMVIGMMLAVFTLALFILYMPITPLSAQLAWQSWAMFGLWLAVGIYFMFRLPGESRRDPRQRTNCWRR